MQDLNRYTFYPGFDGSENQRLALFNMNANRDRKVDTLVRVWIIDAYLPIPQVGNPMDFKNDSNI